MIMVSLVGELILCEVVAYIVALLWITWVFNKLKSMRKLASISKPLEDADFNKSIMG